MNVKIWPINTGFIKLDKGVYVTGGQGYGEEIDVPCWAFLMIHGGEKILVDTGMSKTETADWHHPGSYQPAGFGIQERLKEKGIAPEEINAVIFTHLHWDHCANMKLFKNATYWVHSTELQFARNPHVLYYKSYECEKLGITPQFDGCAFKTVKGEVQYNDTITLFPTPGHCPGHQSVAVKTGKETIVIAGDAVFSDYNLQPDKKRNLPFTPNARYVNVFDLYESMQKIIERADIVLTAHGGLTSMQAEYSL